MVQGSTAVNRMPLCREHRKVIPGGRFRGLTKRARCGRTITWKHQPIAWERCGSSPRHRISQAHRMLARGDYQRIRGRRTSLPADKCNGARNGAKVTRRGKGNGNPLARGAGTGNEADPHVAAWDGVWEQKGLRRQPRTRSQRSETMTKIRSRLWRIGSRNKDGSLIASMANREQKQE